MLSFEHLCKSSWFSDVEKYLFDQIDRLTMAIISEKVSSPFLSYQDAVSMLTSTFVWPLSLRFDTKMSPCFLESDLNITPQDNIVDDLETRLYQDLNRLFPTCYTATRLPLKLLYSEQYPSSIDDLRAEKQIQGWSRKKKNALISGDWDKLSYLAQRNKK